MSKRARAEEWNDYDAAGPAHFHVDRLDRNKEWDEVEQRKIALRKRHCILCGVTLNRS